MLKKNLIYLLVFILLISGCGKPESTLSLKSFRINMEDLVRSREMIVKRWTVSAYGKKFITIQSASNKEQVVFENANQSKLSNIRIMIVVMKVPAQKNTPGQVVRLIQIVNEKGWQTGGTVTESIQTTQSTIPEAAPYRPLLDVAEFKITPGDYPVGQPVDMAIINGHHYTLAVYENGPL